MKRENFKIAWRETRKVFKLHWIIEYICNVQDIHELNWTKPAKKQPKSQIKEPTAWLYLLDFGVRNAIFARFYGRRIFTAPIISSRFPFLFLFFRFAELFEEQKINEANEYKNLERKVHSNVSS